MESIREFLGPIGLVMVIILLLAVIVFFLVGVRRRRSRADLPLLDPEFDAEEIEVEAEAIRPEEHADFPTLLEQMVLPLTQAHPDWERLDGAYDVPGEPIAWFTWNGVHYSLGGETHVRAMLQTWEWMQANPGEDPLVVQHTESGAGHLTLRPEIGWKDAKAVRIETG